MLTKALKNTLIISLLGHTTIFSLFSFSFGYKIPRVDYVSVSFWGGILRAADLAPFPQAKGIDVKSIRDLGIKEAFVREFNIKPIEKADKGYPGDFGYYFKPVAFLGIKDEKAVFIPEKTPISLPRRREIPAIMFYPSLPHHFLLYFKDRQLAHIELMFNIISGQKMNPVVIKRKISSGNLEADLLSMRYISHYLFIQQAAFPSDIWQTVKIEFSPKDDKH